MKTLLKYLLMLSIFTVPFVTISFSHADNDFDWNDEIMARYLYDSGTNDLEITIYLEDINQRPDLDYNVELEVDNDDYEKKMSYSSSRDELFATFRFSNIDDDEIDDYLDLEIEINDEDNNEVFDGRIEMKKGIVNNNDNLDWEDLEVYYDYNESRERLHIEVKLDEITSSPKNTYTVYIEADNKDFDERMFYSSSKDVLAANFYISWVEKDELDDYLELEVKIKDNKSNTLYNEDTDLDDNSSSTNSSSSTSNSSIDWSELKTWVIYEKENNRLIVRTQLDNIEKVGTGEEYSVRLSVDGKTYNLNMFYSPANKRLYAYKDLNVFSESRVDNSYNVWIVIKNEDDNTVYNQTKKILTSKNWSAVFTNNNTSNNSTSGASVTSFSQSQSNGEILAYRYIYRVEWKYSNASQRINALSNLINALKNVRYSYSNKTYIDSIIDTLSKRIQEYNMNSNSHNSSSNIYSPATNSLPWRLIKTNSGEFRYYWWYNY